MITISLCMIVKNEQDVIARCLESVKNIVDEIIIVDTGSSDRTVEIASHYTQNIYHFDWIDDFSAARNFSFSKATKEYILWLDADDVIQSEHQKEFITLKQTLPHTIDVVMLPYHVAFDENNQAIHSYYRERLLKRESNFKWLGAVHEAIPPNGNVVFEKAAVSHKKMHPSDPNRNIRIFEKLLSEGQKLEPRQQFYYARELYYHNQYHEAISLFKQFLKEQKGWKENNISACIDLANCYKQINQQQKALLSLYQSFSYDIPRGEVCCEIGNIFLSHQQYQMAIFWFQTASEQKPDISSGGFFSTDCYDYIPYLQLCVCYDKLEDYKTAAMYNQKAKQCKPNDKIVLQNENYFKNRGILL